MCIRDSARANIVMFFYTQKKEMFLTCHSIVSCDKSKEKLHQNSL